MKYFSGCLARRRRSSYHCRAMSNDLARRFPDVRFYNPALVEVRVNDQPAAAPLVVRRDLDGALLIRSEDLPQLRLRTPSSGLTTIDGERYLRFDAKIGASVAFDDATQSARVTLPPDAFLPTRSSALSPDAPQVTKADLGGFVNYDLFGEQVDDRTSLGSILDIGVFGSRGVVTNSLIGRHNVYNALAAAAVGHLVVEGLDHPLPGG